MRFEGVSTKFHGKTIWFSGSADQPPAALWWRRGFYTAFLCRALDQLGVPTTLYVHADTTFWPHIDLPSSTLIERVGSPAALARMLPRKPLWLLSHGPQFEEILAARDPGWLITAMAHMPLQGAVGQLRRTPPGLSGLGMGSCGLARRRHTDMGLAPGGVSTRNAIAQRHQLSKHHAMSGIGANSVTLYSARCPHSYSHFPPSFV